MIIVVCTPDIPDYVPDGLSELADALANPIRYQSRIEKHATQLLALTGGDDEESAEDITEQPSIVDPSDCSLRSGTTSSVQPEHHTTQQVRGDLQKVLISSGCQLYSTYFSDIFAV